MATSNLRRWSAQVALTAAATAAVLKAADDTTNDYVYVTKLILSITTVATGKATTLTDSAASPITYARYTDITETAANNKQSLITFDFGRRGVRMTKGKSATVTGEASGSAGWAFGEGYQRLV